MKGLLLFLALLIYLPIVAQDDTEGKVLGEIVETNPSYPGGLEQFYKYISDNASPKEGASGQVFVSFFVEASGEISEASIVKGLDEETDNNILSLINAMPKWRPAMIKGKAVRKKMVFPLTI